MPGGSGPGGGDVDKSLSSGKSAPKCPQFKTALVLACPEFGLQVDDSEVDLVISDLSECGIDSLEDLKLGYGDAGGDEKLAALLSDFDTSSPTAGVAPGMQKLLEQVRGTPLSQLSTLSVVTPAPAYRKRRMRNLHGRLVFLRRLWLRFRRRPSLS